MKQNDIERLSADILEHDHSKQRQTKLILKIAKIYESGTSWLSRT